MNSVVDVLRKTKTKYCLALLAACFGVIFSNSYFVHADEKYGYGNYGACQYGSCSISLTTLGTVSIDVTPALAGSCTVEKDVVTVQTDNSNGYSLMLVNQATDTALSSSPYSIPASSGTLLAPTTLATNTWGYRVDDVGGFGPGPTAAQSNGTTPSETFAGVQPSDQPADVITTSSSAASTGVDTNVWYGVCADQSIESGTYTSTVLYTAITN